MNLHSLVQRPSFIPEFTAWDALRDLRIGITGHRGLLGSLLSERLDRAGVDYVIYEGDVTDEAMIEKWLCTARPEALFHLAAVVPVQRVLSDPLRSMQVNATSLLAIARATAKRGSDIWMFLASTSHVYDTVLKYRSLQETSPTIPVTLYGATKLAGEQIMVPLASHFGMRLCVGRIFSYFHERQSAEYLVPGLAKRMREAQDGEEIAIRDANSVRDFLHADMVVDAVLGMCARRYSGIVNIASGRAVSVGQIANRLIAISGKTLSMNRLPSGHPTRLIADVTKLRRVMGSGDKG